MTENRKVKQRQVLRESYGYSGVSFTESKGKLFATSRILQISILSIFSFAS